MKKLNLRVNHGSLCTTVVIFPMACIIRSMYHSTSIHFQQFVLILYHVCQAQVSGLEHLILCWLGELGKNE